ncbi:hypothetical protein C2G38_885729 [Gigaspora rosea]|uniref:Uncharacterized protein n=1 Tax=Gigaspora rosea TaxID=44941 RepID=A0A397TWC6_9GLOM|nr:hypothetical protein C2G38_885729 [Gigaspora rosea]
MMTILNYPIEQRIKGANEYKDSLKDLFNYINAYIEANNEKAKSFKEYSRIKLQVEMFKNKEERLIKKIKDYESKQDCYDECAFLLLERFINIKCWMQTYLENYRYAYKYWSLSESEVNLSVKKTTAEHMEDNNKIYQELENTYYKFGGPPQTSMHPISLPTNYTEKFKNDKFITYEISLNHEEFQQCERVRLINFRVFLKGIGKEDDEISLSISNTNMFNDKYKNNHYQFISHDIFKVFKYKVPDKILTPLHLNQILILFQHHLPNGKLSFTIVKLVGLH